MKKISGVDENMQKILDAKMDEVYNRRRAREAFKDIQHGIDYILFQTPCDGLAIKEGYDVNSRGIEVFCKSWLPSGSKPKAAIFYCHGYGDTCTFFFEGIARKMASSGFAVFAMDYPGFGLSEGLHGFIHNFDRLVDDVIEQYTKIKEHSDFDSVPKFLFGESMGGAVALKMHLKEPRAWDGAILCAPMCKISENMIPPKLVTQVLIGIANVLPKNKLVPSTDLMDEAFKDPKKREMTDYNVIMYKDKPRLRTAVELLKVTEEIEKKSEQVSLPLLVLHGEADTVTDPSVSKSLYDKATSSDKTLKLYPNACHALLEGETDEIIMQVFGDILAWLDARSLEYKKKSSS